MSINEPTNEKPLRILTDVDNKIVFLPDLTQAREFFKKDLITPSMIDDIKKVSTDIFLASTSSLPPLENDPEIKIGAVIYKQSMLDTFGIERNISTTLSPPDGSNLPSIDISIDYQTGDIKTIRLTSPEINIKGIPPFSISKNEALTNNNGNLQTDYTKVWIEFPKKKIKFGMLEEDNYDNIAVNIFSSGEIFSTSLELSNDDNSSFYGHSIIKMIELKPKRLKNSGLIKPREIDKNIIYLHCTNERERPGTQKYEVAKNILFSLVQDITGRDCKDITRIKTLEEELFGYKT